MAKKDWTIVERTQDLVDSVYDKYRNVPVTDEMLDDLYNFAMMKEKYFSMVESKKKVESSNAIEKIYRKLMVTNDMVEYVLEKYGKNWNIKDEIADVIWEDMDLDKAKQVGDDVGLVDASDVDLVDALDHKNKVKKLEGDFSSDEGFSSDEDVVCFNDVKYHLTDAEIMMFKETPTTSKGPRRQLASTATVSRAPIASTTSKAPRCILSSFAPNAPPPFHHKREVQALAIQYPLFCMLMMYLYDDVLDIFGLLILCFILSLAMYVDV
nr:hypothetical protein [Tanacetum cinerariifolium]